MGRREDWTGIVMKKDGQYWDRIRGWSPTPPECDQVGPEIPVKADEATPPGLAIAGVCAAADRIMREIRGESPDGPSEPEPKPETWRDRPPLL